MKTVREMAEEAGFGLWSANSIDDDEIVAETGVVITDQLERFAALVRAQALEEAAKEVESVDGRILFDAPEVVRANVTSAIRALVKEK